jgi:hypothetical protein
MGCRKSRTMYSASSTENQELIRYESTFLVYKIPFQELEAVCRRTPTASTTKILNLINKTFSTSIPLDLFEKTSVSYSDFLIFFIISGKGSAKDKNSALWYLFDTELEGELNKNTFKKLLKSVIRGSVEISLKYYLSINSSTLLASWNQQLVERFDSLEVRLAKHFLEENDSISYEVFKAKTEEMPLGMISSASALRTQLEHTQVIPTRFANPFKSMKVTKLTN